MQKSKTIVVMPAYNAEETLEKTVNDLPLDYVNEIILGDDASRDDTVVVAKRIVNAYPKFTLSPEDYARDPHKILFTIIEHDQNNGYGGNQKKCYRVALAHGADIVVMVHPDYQYDPKLVKYFVEFIRDGYFDVMLGSRIRSRHEALAGGMPAYKYYANRALSLMQNIASGRSLSEWHTGMRAYTREVLQNIGYDHFSDDFVFDTQALFAIVERGYSVGDIPVPVRYFKEASSINFARSIRYGLLTVWETVKFVVRNTPQFLRYLTVGALAFGVNLTTYVVLLSGAHVWYTTAAAIAFCIGAVVSFTLHKFWTFSRRSLRRVHYELALYLLVVVLNGFINTFLLYFFVHDFFVDKVFANIVSNAVVALWSFFIYKHLTFIKMKSKEGENFVTLPGVGPGFRA